MCKVATETKVYRSCGPKKDKTKILHEKKIFLNIVLLAECIPCSPYLGYDKHLSHIFFKLLSTSSLSNYFNKIHVMGFSSNILVTRCSIYFQIDILVHVLLIIPFYCKILINYFSTKRYGLRIHNEFPLFSIVVRKLRSN